EHDRLSSRTWNVRGGEGDAVADGRHDRDPIHIRVDEPRKERAQTLCRRKPVGRMQRPGGRLSAHGRNAGSGHTAQLRRHIRAVQVRDPSWNLEQISLSAGSHVHDQKVRLASTLSHVKCNTDVITREARITPATPGTTPAKAPLDIAQEICYCPLLCPKETR